SDAAQGTGSFAGYGADVNDDPVVLLQHRRQNSMNAVISAVEIGPHQQLPIFRRQLPKRAASDVEAGVVDQDVNGTELFFHATDKSFNLFHMSEIGRMEEEVTALKRFGGLAQSRLLAAGDRHTGTVLQESTSDS